MSSVRCTSLKREVYGLVLHDQKGEPAPELTYIGVCPHELYSIADRHTATIHGLDFTVVAVIVEHDNLYWAPRDWTEIGHSQLEAMMAEGDFA